MYYAISTKGLADPAGNRNLAVIVGIIGLIVTVAGAVPIVWSLMQRGPLSLKRLLLPAVALGNAPLALYLIWLTPFTIMHLVDGTMSQHLIPLSGLFAAFLVLTAFGSFMGIVSAFVFWLIAVKVWGKHAAEEAIA